MKLLKTHSGYRKSVEVQFPLTPGLPENIIEAERRLRHKSVLPTLSHSLSLSLSVTVDVFQSSLSLSLVEFSLYMASSMMQDDSSSSTSPSVVSPSRNRMMAKRYLHMIDFYMHLFLENQRKKQTSPEAVEARRVEKLRILMSMR
ncbi:hypothetical protein RIF29_14139 [Crotalaria pallida]|uniref:Uncharacterized protein n=1 Tax=Crotalaria pallida TaxID=3830 RepID=A0AAN9FJI1_CROPI